MFPNYKVKKIALPDGREISIETGRLARQADASVIVRLGSAMLLATVVSSPDPREGANFLPLSVDYQEKFASAGRIPGGFLKREGRLGDHEILISRLVDRAIRPLFPKKYYYDTQVNIFLISADDDVKPDALVALATSTALTISDIPFAGPISEVRVAQIDGEMVVNPTATALQNATLDLMIGATEADITMVEGEMKEVSEDTMLEALRVGHAAIKTQCQAQKEFAEELGRTTTRDYIVPVENEELKKQVFDETYGKFLEIAKSGYDNKTDRKNAFSSLKKEYLNALPEEGGPDVSEVKELLAAVEKKASRDLVLKDRIRLDGRKTDEVRPIDVMVDFLPGAHGSAVFTRGETQSLTTVTLGTKLDEKLIDNAMLQTTEKFLLHYNFPGFSTGEVKPNRGPGRREVGHGNLALRALKPVIPTGDDNPYTIRVVSDILESNGSSSMATVCAGSLALMDAGIPITGGVSGVAMGMISDPETGEYAILTDILGDEDHLGDMDFKVTGTAKGITACQMDIKIDGLKYEVLKEALEQARRGREHILGVMNQALEGSREDVKDHAPRSVTVKIEKDKIGAVIGPGGKVIQEIQAKTETTIVIEEKDGAGYVNIFATTGKAMEAAQAIVNGIVAEPEVGATYDGVVKSIMAYGAFVEFMPGKEGLLHISEITWERLESMDGILEEGEEIKIKLLDVDQRTGKFKLSRKVLLPKPEGYVEPPKRERSERGDRDNRGGDRRRGGDRNDRRGGNDRRGDRDNRGRDRDQNRKDDTPKEENGDTNKYRSRFEDFDEDAL